MTIMDFAKNKHKTESKKYQSTLQIENQETMPKELMVASIAIGRKWGGVRICEEMYFHSNNYRVHFRTLALQIHKGKY